MCLSGPNKPDGKADMPAMHDECELLIQRANAERDDARRAFNALLDEVMAQRISAYRAGWSDRNLVGPKASMPTDDHLRATLGLGLRGYR